MLQVIDSLNVGGAERVVLHLALHLDRSRFEVGVCCTKFRGLLAGEAVAAGVPVLDANAPSGLLRYTVPLRLRNVVRRFGADIVHSHGAPAMLHSGPAAICRQLPSWVHTFHFGNYPHLSARVLKSERFFSKYVDALVAVSESQRRSIMEVHRLADSRIRTILNGVATRPSRPAAEMEADRRQLLGAPPEAVLVGCVAVLTKQKGISHLIEAAGSLRQTLPQARFVVIGGGPLEADLRAQARALDLQDVMTFTGWRTDALDLLPILDVFVMPSLWEAMPMVLLEAMAAARAIVVTDVGDNAVVIEDQKSGMIVPPRSTAALAAAISHLIDNPALRETMGREARDRFTQHYDVSRMVAAYESLYESMV